MNNLMITMIVYPLITFFIGIIVGDFHSHKNGKEQ